MAQVASYFAKVGVDVDVASFSKVDKYLASLEKKLNGLANRSKATNIPVRVSIDSVKTAAYLQKSLNVIGKGLRVKVAGVDVNVRNVLRMLNQKLSLLSGGGMISINARLSVGSLRAMQQQVKTAIQNIVVSPTIRPNVVSTRISPNVLPTGIPRESSGGTGRRGSSGRAVLPWLRGDTGWSPAAMLTAGRFFPPMIAAYAGAKGLVANNQAVQQNYAQTTAMDTLFQNAIQPDGSTVDLRSQANKVLMEHVRSVGLDLKSVRPEFTNFMASAMPAMGFDQASEAFKSFTKFGMVRGADTDSIQRALKAIGQMASKGQVYAEELKQQLGDASGFGEMLPIFAQAYQESQNGVGSAKNLVGQKAIAALIDAMKKGKVKTPDVLPAVTRIANERSAPGIAAIANSPQAQQNRASTAATAWTDAFSQGGGARAWATLWKMIAESIEDSTKYAKNLGHWFEVGITYTKWFKDSVDQLMNAVSGKDAGIDENSMFAGIISDNTLGALRNLRQQFVEIADKLVAIAPAAQTTGGILMAVFGQLLSTINLVAAAINTISEMIWKIQESRVGRALLGAAIGGIGGFAVGGPAGGLAGLMAGGGLGMMSDASSNPNKSVLMRDPYAASKERLSSAYSTFAGTNQNLAESYRGALFGPSPNAGSPSTLYRGTNNSLESYTQGGRATSGYTFSGTQNINVNVQGTNASPEDIARAIQETQRSSYKSVLNTSGASKPR